MRLPRRKPDGEIERELRYHFEKLVHDFIAAGVSPGNARRRARLEFGGLEQINEECRDVRGHWLEDFGQDLIYTWRTLGRSPGFLAVSVLSLALGIGANTAVFSLINALLLRSLPVKDPQHLVHITRLDLDNKPLHVSWQLFKYLRDHLKSISGASAERQGHFAITIQGADEIVSAALVSGDHYTVLGVEPIAGRLLQPADDSIAPGNPAAVISYRLWERRFGLNPSAIGQTFTIAGRTNAFTIVGVTAPSYHGAVVGSDPDITLPLTCMLSADERNEPTLNNLNMLGRVAPGATRQHANAELQVLWHAWQQRIAATMPEVDRPSFLRARAAVLSGRNGLDPLRYQYSEALLVLMGIVCLVLLLACANISGLLVARAASRQREISIRLAIGASRGRLVRQFLTESLVLAALGGSAGLLLAHWFSTILVTTMAAGETITLAAALDWRVLTFTTIVSLLVCALTGLAPALHAFQDAPHLGLRRFNTAGQQRFGRTLVVAQLCISMVLVTGAALFGATLEKLYAVDRGLRTDGILTFSLRTDGKCPPERCRTATISLLERLNTLPGVASASAVDVLPVSGSLWDRDVQVQGYTFRPGEDQTAAFNATAPKFFVTVETPLLKGREFDSRDTRTSANVAVINEAFARYYFGSASPLGRTVTSNNVTYEIVGVVANAKYTDLKQAPLKTIYIPWTQRTEEEPMDFNFLVRVPHGDPLRLSPVLEKLIHQTDAHLRLNATATWSTVIDRTIVTERIMAGLGGFFGLIALIIAAVGIFGVMSFRVSRRANEIGVRMALGASRAGILGVVFREVMAMLIAGCLAGALIALCMTRLARVLLFETSPADPIAFGTAAALLIVAGLIAAWIPASHAARVDPVLALRCE
ncbi:MAG: ABC transporter permease [Acidobacteriaceae bacterium]|nr:ABC transporter permease [Acidobacteriaceae bacterium]